MMRTTTFNGEAQEIVLPDGTPKGMNMVLEERGVCTKDMISKDMVKKLKEYDDFKNSKSIDAVHQEESSEESDEAFLGTAKRKALPQ